MKVRLGPIDLVEINAAEAGDLFADRRECQRFNFGVSKGRPSLVCQVRCRLISL